VATLDIERFAAFQPTQIEAGPAGWVILGEQPNGPETAGWISVDGQCWEPIPDEIDAHGAAVGDLEIVITSRDGSVWAGEPRGDCR